MQENSYNTSQSSKRTRLARFIMTWLSEPGAAAVILNEIHPSIAETFLQELREKAPAMNIQKATSQSNSLLWRAPQ